MQRLTLARFVSALAALALSFAGPLARAHACSAPACIDTILLPAGTAADPAQVPASAAFVSVTVRGGAATGATVSAERTRGGATATLALGAPGVLALTDAQEGDVFVVRETHDCSGSAMSFTTTIQITAGVALPTVLGTLSIDPPARASVTVSDGSGPCTSPIDSVVAAYTVTLDPANAAWTDAIDQATFVDGAAWYEPSWLAGPAPTGARFVYAACVAPTPGQGVFDLDEGEHLVRVEGHVRGTTTTVTTSEERVTLRCSPGADGGALPDASVPADAGTSVDAGPASTTSAGCGCTVGGRSPASLASLGLGLLAILVLARRGLVRG